MSDSYQGEPNYNSAAEQLVAPPDGAPAPESTPDETSEPQKQYLDLDDDIAQRYVRVKVDGQDVEVPLGEALKGYSREADYTRKAQALAEQRREAEYALTLKAALDSSPREAIEFLARRAGLTVAEMGDRLQAEADRQQGLDPYSQQQEDDRFADPVERRIGFLERQLQERDARDQQAAADHALRQAIGGLQSKYQANDADVRDVVATALQMQAGPEQFDLIYRGIQFDRMQQARAQAQQQRQQEDAQRQSAKEQIGQVQQTGGSSAQAGGTPPPKTEFSSYREAIEAGFDQLGV